jgi:hypothetical protein
MSIPPSPPPNGNQPPAPPPDGLPKSYKGEFIVPPEFKKMWTNLFKASGQLPDNKQMAKMTEQFINQVWNDCNTVLQHALQNLKDIEQQRKDDENS